MSDQYLLDQVTRAYKQEKKQKKLFEAQKRDEWNVHPARMAVAEAVKDALDSGIRKASINRAMGSSNFTTFQRYLDLLTDSNTVSGENRVNVIAVSDIERLVTLHNYVVDNELHSGEIKFELIDGDWLNQTDTPAGVAAEKELFFSDQPNALKEAFNNV